MLIWAIYAETKTAMFENRMQSECLRTATGSRLRDSLSSRPISGETNGYIEGNAEQQGFGQGVLACVRVSVLIKNGRVLCPS